MSDSNSTSRVWEVWGITTEHTSTPVSQATSRASVRASWVHLLFFFNFYWRIGDLQCCISFCCTAK